MSKNLLIDIKPQKNEGEKYPRQINLSYKKVIRIPLKSILSGVFVFFFITSFILNPVSWYGTGFVSFAPSKGDVEAAGTTADKAEERKQLESQLAELEKQMDEYETQISSYKKQGKSLQSEIDRLNKEVAKLNVQIKSVLLLLNKVNQELDVTQKRMLTTQEKIAVKKEIVADVIQNIYENENKGILMVLLANDEISDFMADLNSLSSVQDQLRLNVEELMGLHTELSDQKEELAAQKNDAITLREFQEKQRKLVEETKKEKDKLLKDTKGKESEYQKILAETQKTAAQIRSRIFDLIGGGQLSFGDAYQYAKVAESKTGVRAALILAVLDKESALGKNVGQCKYNENPYYPAKATNKTTMHPTRDIPIYLDITKKLGLNPELIKVSCPIPSDGAYGGGMGPAQFIPSTWKLYEARIASLTGNNPPSPWKFEDAFMATALYMKDGGAAGGTIAAEKAAAAKYYAGSRWKNYLNTYGASVVSRADRFEQDIRALNGN